MGDMSYDSHSYDKQYEYEMNRRNASKFMISFHQFKAVSVDRHVSLKKTVKFKSKSQGVICLHCKYVTLCNPGTTNRLHCGKLTKHFKKSSETTTTHLQQLIHQLIGVVVVFLLSAVKLVCVVWMVSTKYTSIGVEILSIGC